MENMKTNPIPQQVKHKKWRAFHLQQNGKGNLTNRENQGIVRNGMSFLFQKFTAERRVLTFEYY